MLRFRPSSDRKHGLRTLWFSGLISLLFPEKCPFCRTLLQGPDKGGLGLCPVCEQDLHWLKPPLCPQCGRPYPEGSSSHLCSECLRGKTAFDGGRAALLYRGVLAEAIQRFKYQGDIHLAAPLGRLGGPIAQDRETFAAVIPVPLHPSRLRERGFNQSLLLGKVLAKKHGLVVNPLVLRRVRDTRPQVELGLGEREKNVRGAFAVAHPESVKGKDLLLVDDVLTTGATVNECARVLKKAGAKTVWVWTLARAG